jgi:hypothetical protein
VKRKRTNPAETTARFNAQTGEVARTRLRGATVANPADRYVDLTLRCPTCGKRADMCFNHGDDWKKRQLGKPRPDFNPRIDYPERYMREGVWSA